MRYYKNEIKTENEIIRDDLDMMIHDWIISVIPSDCQNESWAFESEYDDISFDLYMDLNHTGQVILDDCTLYAIE